MTAAQANAARGTLCGNRRCKTNAATANALSTGLPALTRQRLRRTRTEAVMYVAAANSASNVTAAVTASTRAVRR